ncbi:hypothetical protein JX266_005158 [Neoarthrinium moseri]|uniref:uncharacterized protein n=1 Tax=Neoarthrinium moseri TaxID=1658444 RepID=UPI001FDB50B3|nr:uncharacterized protein JN550_006492 [Neoarthrinium moseri]KAI1849197.1 hypothetical protein JX266_005158 [Neoarthrinium moseri]KAI1868576.1 hypothetical protein JN550_006492 [Neoarthrinium moseri]
MLPKPTLSFTIPSVHDHTKLDCRVFHPASLGSQPPNAPRWGRHVAVVAHPYAPLGGSYDDPVVDVVAGTLLQLGFMVATFNFRGASSSSGARTSWTSRPEQADYMSVVGFMAYYAHYIDSPHRISTEGSVSPIMLQAGYSYGAMVTTKLPPLDTILAIFESPPIHGAAADIRLRAQHLAEQQNRLLDHPASPRKSLGMRVGGDEELPRQSRERRRSHSLDREERIRKGVRDILARTKRIHRKHRHESHDHAGEAPVGEEECMAKAENPLPYRSAYVAVSPPIGVVTNLATMSFANPFSGWPKRAARADGPGTHHEGAAEPGLDASETKLARNPTLAVYGDQDGFLTLRKFREWTTKLKAHEDSRFCDKEVSGAGHFWVEEGVMYELRNAVGAFATELLGFKAQILQPYDGS